jgi:hypothetical protein
LQADGSRALRADVIQSAGFVVDNDVDQVVAAVVTLLVAFDAGDQMVVFSLLEPELQQTHLYYYGTLGWWIFACTGSEHNDLACPMKKIPEGSKGPWMSRNGAVEVDRNSHFFP